MTTYRYLLVGDSLALPISETEDVPSNYKGLCQTWSRVAFRRCPWQPMTRYRGPDTNPVFIGQDAAFVQRLIGLGHSVHGIQVSLGSTTLGADWLSPSGTMYLRTLAEIPLATASSNCPANPGASNTIALINLGTNDALTSDAFCVSATAQANMAALLAGLRGVVGAAMKSIIMLPSTALPAPATGTRITNIRAGLNACIAADGGKSVAYDPSALATIGDGIHYTQAANLTMGSAKADLAVAL